MKPKPVPAENLRNIEKIIIPLVKRERNTKRIKKSIIKMEYHKISKLLNNPTLSKFVTRK